MQQSVYGMRQGVRHKSGPHRSHGYSKQRLQGFPDDATAIPGASDTARYAALGNSMAVPVMRWLGERIAKVDALLKEAA